MKALPTHYLRVLPLVALLCATAGAADASSRHFAAARQAHMVAVSFRLDIAGKPAPNMTFWVAYGPLNGRFGLIRLWRAGPGEYSATKKLAAGTRTIFSYVVGIGTIHTRFGDEPGGRTFTIKRFSPRTVTAGSLPIVHWQAPVG